MKLQVTIEVENDIEAYRVVNRLGFMGEVKEAKYRGRAYKFNKEKGPKKFLRRDFN